MFREVSTKLDFPKIEESVLQFWRQNDIFRKSMRIREGSPEFVFLEGPPTANGRPGVHHILSRIMKDIICRYKTMNGYYVYRKAGWDTHGLPVEIEVEKELGISGKGEIERYGIERFVERCKESVFRYEKEWRRMTERIGFWIDMDNPYITLTNDYIETLWWVLKKFWEAGLLYQGYKVVPYCPRCGTALSSHEVAQGYAEVEDPSVFVKMAVRGQPDTYFLVWTTTPWTLPSNVALTVHPEYDYVMVRHDGSKYILAKGRIAYVFRDEEPEIIRSFKGEELFGWEYEPLFSFARTDKKAFYVVTGDFVTLDEGTGIVHTAPAFGQEDYEMAQRYDLPVVQLVDPQGNFTQEVTPWAGMFVKEADPLIIEDLENRGLLFRSETYKHDYPFCWRCDTPLLYYARSSWFIRTTAFKDRMMEMNDQVNWYPEHIKQGRFGDWLKNNVDWAISRERYWGTPLNIWNCQECGKQVCIGSIAELKELGEDLPEEIELHRPYIDRVILRCPECGGQMRRVPEVVDCWFDSGCAHTAQWHYPFENKERTERTVPADFISEAIDQTRGWFYSLLVTSTFLYNRPAYRNVLCLELVLGADGQKMSKSRGNAVDPWEVLDVQGADAVRWYFYTVTPPWVRRIFSKEAVNEALRKFLGTLHNVYAFFVLYANVDKINPLRHDIPVSDRPLIDRWIISKFNSLVAKVREDMDDFQITSAARSIDRFVDDLSNWYVRRSRDRFWGSEMGHDKFCAYRTLYEILVDLSKLLAPFTPFISEEIYQNLVRSIDADAPESVHLCDYPESRSELIDRELEEDMELVREFVVLGRAARNRAGIKVRQPLRRIVLGLAAERERRSVERFPDLVREELNIKEIEFATDLADYARITVRPNFKLLGPKYGATVQKIARTLAQSDPAWIKREIDSQGEVKLQIDGEEVTLEKEELDLRFEGKEGYAVEVEGEHFVALWTEIDEELALEGIARELVNKIQQMRKEADFNVADRIELYLSSTEQVHRGFDRHRSYVMGETLAVKLVEEPSDDMFLKSWNINGHPAKIGVKRVEGYRPN